MKVYSIFFSLILLGIISFSYMYYIDNTRIELYKLLEIKSQIQLDISSSTELQDLLLKQNIEQVQYVT